MADDTDPRTAMPRRDPGAGTPVSGGAATRAGRHRALDVEFTDVDETHLTAILHRLTTEG